MMRDTSNLGDLDGAQNSILPQDQCIAKVSYWLIDHTTGCRLVVGDRLFPILMKRNNRLSGVEHYPGLGRTGSYNETSRGR